MFMAHITNATVLKTTSLVLTATSAVLGLTQAIIGAKTQELMIQDAAEKAVKEALEK